MRCRCRPATGPGSTGRACVRAGRGGVGRLDAAAWYTASVSYSGGEEAIYGHITANGWGTTDLAKLVAGLAVVAIVGWVADELIPLERLPACAATIAAGIGAVCVLLVIYRLVVKPHSPYAYPGILLSYKSYPFGVSTSYGIYLALAAAVVVAVGGVIASRST